MNRVLQVLSYYPPHIGGIEFCAQHLANELAERGVDVCALTSDVGSSGPGEFSEGKVRVVRLPALEVAHTPLIRGLARRLHRECHRGPVVHLHLGHVHTDVVTALVCRIRRIALLAHFHMDTPPSGRLGGLLRCYKSLVFPFVLRSATRVIVLSDAQAQWVARVYRVDERRIGVISNGVDLAAFAALTAPATGARPLQLLFVGRLAPQKNLSLLVRSLVHTTEPMQLHVVGDGECRDELGRLVQARGLVGRVTFHGFLQGEELMARWADGEVLVVPSEREGMPLSLLEGMAAGLPVVASAVPGLVEFVGEAGLTVPPGSVAELAAALDRMARDAPLREQCGAAGRRYAAEHSWKSVADRFTQEYRIAQASMRSVAG